MVTTIHTMKATVTPKIASRSKVAPRVIKNIFTHIQKILSITLFPAVILDTIFSTPHKRRPALRGSKPS